MNRLCKATSPSQGHGLAASRYVLRSWQNAGESLVMEGQSKDVLRSGSHAPWLQLSSDDILHLSSIDIQKSSIDKCFMRWSPCRIMSGGAFVRGIFQATDASCGMVTNNNPTPAVSHNWSTEIAEEPRVSSNHLLMELNAFLPHKICRRIIFVSAASTSQGPDGLMLMIIANYLCP